MGGSDDWKLDFCCNCWWSFQKIFNTNLQHWDFELSEEVCAGFEGRRVTGAVVDCCDRLLPQHRKSRKILEGWLLWLVQDKKFSIFHQRCEQDLLFQGEDDRTDRRLPLWAESSAGWILLTWLFNLRFSRIHQAGCADPGSSVGVLRGHPK